MNRLLWTFLVLLLSRGHASIRAESPAGAAPSTVLQVDSGAFAFSPANWLGDEGREGSAFRETWNPGAYVRITWETQDAKVAPTLLLDTSVFPEKAKPPILACSLDGLWSGDVPCAPMITLPALSGPGKHSLTLYLKKSEQKDRWGSPGKAGTNILRLTGIRVDGDSKPLQEDPQLKPWALIVGDSITEGVGAYELEGYSHLVGQALLTQGYEYAISACGWSGWLHRGDNPPGDVPGYYVVTDSRKGTGGTYQEADSRWNKIDANHSLLDDRGHLSGYGLTGQEPSVILINYGTNDAIHKTNDSDLKASMSQCLVALRGAAPAAHIVLLVPFGQYRVKELRETVRDYLAAHPEDHRLTLLDLGPEVARSLGANGYWGGLHPNPRAHATLGSQVTAHLMAVIAKQP